MIEEKIRQIEEEIRNTKKNKASEKHLGILKAKLARLRASLAKRSGGSSSGFSIPKSGNARVVLVGFPSSGKSTLLSSITDAQSKSGSYAFTTTTVVPGTLKYKGALIQILDLPGILEGASKGRGRGKEILSVVRSADLVVIVLDSSLALEQFDSLLKELYEIGMRLNKKPKRIYIEKRYTNGIEIVAPLKLSLSNETISSILREYGMHNAFVSALEDFDIEELIDVLEGNRVYVKAFVVVNKADLLSKEERCVILKEISKKGFDVVFTSSFTKEGLEKLKEEIYNNLSFIRVYTKPRDGEVNKEPLILKKGSTIEDLCRAIHKDVLRNFKYALVTGKSVKFPSQRVGLKHKLEEGDVVTVVYDKI